MTIEKVIAVDKLLQAAQDIILTEGTGTDVWVKIAEAREILQKVKILQQRQD